MTSRQPKQRSLRNLINDIPPDNELLKIIISLLHQSAHSAAILGASLLEEELKRAIQRNLPVDKDSEQLFHSDNGIAPLGDLSAKIQIAFAMGIIDEQKNLI